MIIEATIGDAYGSGYEFAPEFVFAQNTLTTKTYLPHADASGYFNRYTDDTQMAIGLTELLIEKTEWTPLTIANKFVEVFKRDVRIGYAGRFFKFLKSVKNGEEFLAKIIPTSERNGASMRVYPLGVLSDEKDILHKAEMQARVTHNTDEGVYSAQLVALSTHYFLYKKGSKHQLEKYIKSLMPINWNFEWTGKVQMRGREAILAALSAIRKHDKLSDILVESVNYQGDVDTVASLAMAIGSVCEEIENDLPVFLFQQLENEKYGRDFLLDLDKKLMDLKIITPKKLMKNENFNKSTNALLGVAIGDALGVPHEFNSREQMRQNPAKEMIGYGRYLVPAGTWSDDSSLTFCLAESLTKGYDLADMAHNFVQWVEANFWTARGEVFDIGITTSDSIGELNRLLQKKKYDELTQLKYLGNEMDNGNGSLMRILPLLWYIKGMDIAEQFAIIRDVSALTHKHIRAAMCCLIYLRLAEHLLNGKNKVESYLLMQKEIIAFWDEMDFSADESILFIRLIEFDIRALDISELNSDGYVMHSIEASIWCFLQRDTYSEVVLTAVNLGHDTDTTAAIAGGLAGLYYGLAGVSESWLNLLARKEDIIALGERLNRKFSNLKKKGTNQEIIAPAPIKISTPSIFLAGSIEQDKAEKWQERFVHETRNLNITLLNPRRKNWDSSWKESIQNSKFKEQVNWELDALELADCIVFYFDPNTKSPISLLELGLFAKSKKLVVCCPDGYWKKGNVDIICQRYNIKQVNSFEKLVQYICEKI